VLIPVNKATEQRLRKRGQISSRQPLCIGFEATQIAASPERSGPGAAILSQSQNCFDVFFRIEAVFVVLFEIVAVGKEANFAEEQAVCRQFLSVSPDSFAAVVAFGIQPSAIKSEIIASVVVLIIECPATLPCAG
jgi:hypothetical protein